MPTVQEIERAMKISAKVVSLYGDKYLPIFNRLHTEFLEALGREKIMVLAIRMAQEYNENER